MYSKWCWLLNNSDMTSLHFNWKFSKKNHMQKDFQKKSHIVSGKSKYLCLTIPEMII